jgi:hypothetical protein
MVRQTRYNLTIYVGRLSCFHLLCWVLFPRLIACWDCGFKSLQEQRCLSFVNDIICCLAEVFATNRSLVQGGSTDWGV